MGEAKVRAALRTEISGGDLSGFRVGHRTARQRRHAERRNQIKLPSSMVEGLTYAQRSEMLVLMRQVRDEYRAGKRERLAVDFVLTTDGRVVIDEGEDEPRHDGLHEPSAT